MNCPKIGTQKECHMLLKPIREVIENILDGSSITTFYHTLLLFECFRETREINLNGTCDRFDVVPSFSHIALIRNLAKPG
ncbi:hypothetical protein ACTXT7_008662 [Hymenolepis weldensis]